MSLETERSLGGAGVGAVGQHNTTRCRLTRQENGTAAGGCASASGEQDSRNAAAGDSSPSVRVEEVEKKEKKEEEEEDDDDDNGGALAGRDANRGSLRPRVRWETWSTSSGYSEGVPRGEEELVPENFEDDASRRRRSRSFHCDHDDFPFCDCLSQPPAGGGSKRQRRALRGDTRRRRRGYIGPSITAFRDAGMEVFDEMEESDIHESETETDNAPGPESDVEGAVGYSEGLPDDPTSAGLLAPPAGASAGIRRASIVTCDSRAGDMYTTPDPIKVAVFGADGVGKSALIVRLLTGRFIGEYDPTMEAVYSYQFPLPGHDLPLQVMDTAGKVEVVEEGRERQVAWGEGFLLVFSLASHASFLALARLRRVILELTPGSPRPMVLVGNKADLSHAREVSDREIRDLADCWGCDYFEVAAPEPWEVVVRPFTALYHAALENRASH